jgi:chromosome segregation ATPase
MKAISHVVWGIALVGAMLLIVCANTGPTWAAKNKNGNGNGNGNNGNQAPKGAEPQAPNTTAIDKAKQAVTDAQTAATAADAQLTNLVAKLRQEFEATPDVAAALADLKKAQSDYDQALAKARDSIKSSDDYKDADKAAVKEASQEHKPHASPSLDELAKAAETGTVTRLELTALTADPTWKQIHANYETALGKVTAFRAVFDQVLQNDPVYKATKAAADAAHANVDTEQKALATAYDNYATEVSSYAGKLASWAASGK